MQDSIVLHIQHALQQPVPVPKYKLWQHTTDGQIVGHYWRDVDSAWEESMLPGWWYAIKGETGTDFYHESGIEISD